MKDFVCTEQFLVEFTQIFSPVMASASHIGPATAVLPSIRAETSFLTPLLGLNNYSHYLLDRAIFGYESEEAGKNI